MRHAIGTVTGAAATIGLASASIAILGQRPDASTAPGRHLYAGALANASLALTLFLIAVIPLRRRQRWPFWALCMPVLTYGIPMLILEGLNVARENVVSTLAPQVGGLGLLITGLILVRPGVPASKTGSVW